ncbi:MAG: DUF58 domain-containing protein [Candidatus Hydrogenedentes bacterium]|nr:DUF58 domain-containing protein [Candidatus Hydrogenedentota bacterium]
MSPETTTEPAAYSLLDADFLRRLERLAILAKRVQLGHIKGERKSRRKGSSVEFADYRDYVQGDDLRHVDWNIFGRLDALYLKLFQEQEDLTVHLLIDASRSMAFGKPGKLAFAAKLAAAIGYIGLVGYDRVSVEAFSESGIFRLPAVRGKGAARELFAFLDGLGAQGRTGLEQSCRSYILRNRSKGIAVLLSDFLDPSGFEGALRRLSQSRCDLFAVQVLSRDELDPQVTGDLKLLDSETGEFTEISVSPSLLRRYRENVGGFCDAVRAFCMARDIGYVLAPSDTPFEELILDMLRAGGMIR